MANVQSRIEQFWNALAIQRRRDLRVEDREFQRRVVLAADALVNAAVRGFFRRRSMGDRDCVLFVPGEPVWAPLVYCAHCLSTIG